eukprot:TRINITY_DN2010_c0_g1_i3.p1 TRINITY_DN2010_c0_g1~~TRINITY_DN2010_c0_g1_i3.p1  ORF type:complete len:494 (-),score=40.21 TRINITY_DN2010_c0_g1_i3:227-1708(-)
MANAVRPAVRLCSYIFGVVAPAAASEIITTVLVAIIPVVVAVAALHGMVWFDSWRWRVHGHRRVTAQERLATVTAEPSRRSSDVASLSLPEASLLEASLPEASPLDRRATAEEPQMPASSSGADEYILTKCLDPGEIYEHELISGIFLAVPPANEKCLLREPISIVFMPSPLGCVAHDGAYITAPVIRGPSFHIAAGDQPLKLRLPICHNEGFTASIYRRSASGESASSDLWQIVETSRLILSNGQSEWVECAVYGFSEFAIGLCPSSFARESNPIDYIQQPVLGSSKARSWLRGKGLSWPSSQPILRNASNAFAQVVFWELHQYESTTKLSAQLSATAGPATASLTAEHGWQSHAVSELSQLANSCCVRPQSDEHVQRELIPYATLNSKGEVKYAIYFIIDSRLYIWETKTMRHGDVLIVRQELLALIRAAVQQGAAPWHSELPKSSSPVADVVQSLLSTGTSAAPAAAPAPPAATVIVSVAGGLVTTAPQS